ncbi:hypothetical protein Tco_1078608 [Tanacetum coccineum]|uniref:Uncharacterized protein n=1 Tax=Tanacetum coccineum TaxID=301880 RepID=A0ABQ5HPG4_9ASTR
MRRNINWADKGVTGIGRLHRFAVFKTKPMRGRSLESFIECGGPSFRPKSYICRSGARFVVNETDIQEKDKNKAKNDKTEHENEKSVKRSQSQP